jgi:hypothetical protein
MKKMFQNFVGRRKLGVLKVLRYFKSLGSSNLKHGNFLSLTLFIFSCIEERESLFYKKIFLLF